MFFFKNFLISGFAVYGFCHYFGAPKKSIPISCAIGGIVWIIYKYIVTYYSNYLLAGFASALALGLLGEFFARIIKTPATIFIIPGLVPMVPGAGMYYSMYYLIYNEYSKFQSVAIETFYIAASLAIGIVASSAITKTIKFLFIKKVG